MKKWLLMLLTGFTFHTGADTLSTAVADHHKQVSTCDLDLMSDSSAFQLSEDTKLYLIKCFEGAYQASYRGYVEEGEANWISQVMILESAEPASRIVPSLELSEAYFDVHSKVLSTYSKGRGYGDCGSTSQTKFEVDEYGYVSWRTTEVRGLDCPLDLPEEMPEWPVVFSQP